VGKRIRIDENKDALVRLTRPGYKFLSRSLSNESFVGTTPDAAGDTSSFLSSDRGLDSAGWPVRASSYKSLDLSRRELLPYLDLHSLLVVLHSFKLGQNLGQHCI